MRSSVIKAHMQRPGGSPQIASVSVTLPPEAADGIKRASELRSAATGVRVTQIDVNEEIVTGLIRDLADNLSPIFYAGVRRNRSIRRIRKTIWLPVPTVQMVSRYAEQLCLPDSTFIVTAILRWFEKQGTTFPEFSGTIPAFNALRHTSAKPKVAELSPIPGAEHVLNDEEVKE